MVNGNGYDYETRGRGSSEKTWRMIFLGAIILLIVGGGLAGGLILLTGVCSRAAQSDVPAPPCQTGMVCVNARDVAKDYKDNEVAADARYLGNTVRISGRIDKIERDNLGRSYVEFKTGIVNNVVRCYFGADNEYLLEQFSRGDMIWVQVTGDGYEYLPDNVWKRSLFTNGSRAEKM